MHQSGVDAIEMRPQPQPLQLQPPTQVSDLRMADDQPIPHHGAELVHLKRTAAHQASRYP